MEIIATLFSVSRSDPWAISFFFYQYNENTLFWGESFNWGVLAEETPPLSALVMSGYCYEKNYYQRIVCHHK